jgi:hypothetical protein
MHKENEYLEGVSHTIEHMAKEIKAGLPLAIAIDMMVDGIAERTAEVFGEVNLEKFREFMFMVRDALFDELLAIGMKVYRRNGEFVAEH